MDCWWEHLFLFRIWITLDLVKLSPQLFLLWALKLLFIIFFPWLRLLLSFNCFIMLLVKFDCRKLIKGRHLSDSFRRVEYLSLISPIGSERERVLIDIGLLIWKIDIFTARRLCQALSFLWESRLVLHHAVNFLNSQWPMPDLVLGLLWSGLAICEMIEFINHNRIKVPAGLVWEYLHRSAEGDVIAQVAGIDGCVFE